MLKHLSFVKLEDWLRVFLVIALLPASLLQGGSVYAAPGLEPLVRLALQAPRGDVDGNGVVDLEDARLVTQYVVGETDTLPYPENADATQDGEITVEDALAIAQRVVGRSRVVTATAEYGLPGKIYAGSLIRVEVFERFFPFYVTGGTVRIKSPSTGYDSGDQPLIFERDGRSLYYHWDTGGLSPAPDYEIHVTLTESETPRENQSALSQASLNNSSQPEVVLPLSPRSFEIAHLAQFQDAFAPAPGIPLEFRRVFPQDSAYAPVFGPLGRGWMYNFDVHLEEFTDGRIAFLGPDGFNRWFESNDDGTYTASPGDYGVLTRDPDGTFQLSEKEGFVYRFRSDLRLDYMQDPNGNRITATYNAEDQLIEVQHTSGQSFHLEYNEHGRISRLIDHVGRETIYGYDDTGTHLLSVMAPGNRVISYTYSLGQGEASDHRLLSIEFPDGTHLYYTYDSQGRIASMEGDGGTGRLVYSYDADGTTYITDAMGGVTTIRANEQRQPTAVIDPLGAMTHYTYDSNFNLIEVTDPLSRTYHLAYDGRGNVIRFTDPLSNTINFGYEPNFNKITWLQDSRGITTSFSYDNSGDLTSISYPDSSTEQFTYDESGSLDSKTNRDGQVITLTHDTRGLLLSKTYPDESVITYTYDIAGNLTSAANDTGVISFEYDSVDRLIRTTYLGNRTFQYEYDAAGKRTRMTDPDGRVLNYEYDAAGRLVMITDGVGQTVVEYQYDAANRRAQKTLGNGAYTTYEYDAAGQITHLINYDSSDSVISRFDYTYDDAGYRLSKETIEGVESYTYDDLNQLTSVTYPDGSTTQFAYDSMGNRLTVVENGVPITYTVNNLNQYSIVGSTVYGYDANGNLISATEGGQTTYYDYDFENRLVRVRIPTETITYTYDAFGLRNARSDAQGTVQYLRDGAHVAIEESTTHETVVRYAWGNVLDEVIRMERSGSSYYYAQDAMLSISDLLNASGHPIEHYQYRVFGEPLATSTLGNPWLFTGVAYDLKTGLQYNRFRYYSPTLGRFITPDPINITGGLNLYSYALNIPTSLSDPDGRGIFLFFAAYPAVKSIIAVATIVAVVVAQIGWARGTHDVMIDPGPAQGPGFSFPNPVQLPTSQWSSLGGGICPTFIQLPPDADAVALHATYLNVSEEQLSGKITVPIEGALMRSDIPIFGVAGGKEFKGYRVEYGEGRNPTEWHLIESSATPQPTTDVGIAEMRLMQGDIDIRGNLATWNTGLKNWVHLPWHPPEDPTDFNGIYTIRLVVEGKDGQTVEDRVTGEVGRVIAQCLPGTAISPDKRVVMHFPEQSLTHPFRVYTILPLTEVGEESPPAPEGSELIGPVYRIREPGDRFAKDITLEFGASKEELAGRNAGHIGIARYDVGKGTWLWLPTVYSFDEGNGIFSAFLIELPTPKAIYALVFDPRNAGHSQPQAEEEPTLAVADMLSTPRSPGVLVHDTFEEGMGQWKPRDRFVGAILARDNAVTSDGSYALALVNESQGGNFAVTVLEQPLDVQEYSIMSFDYRIPHSVKTDFYLRANGRWYNLGFTDDPVNFRNRDVNIANLGRIEGIVADDQWHAASVNLYDLLRQKTRHTRVDAIMMADWDVGGYMKLEFGHNARGATYYIDNFRIAADPVRETSDVLMVDTFDTAEPTNLVGGPSDTFSNPGTNYCQATVADDITAEVQEDTAAGHNGVLELTFDTLHSNAYCGYWTALMAANLAEMDELSLRLHTATDVPPMFVGLRDAATGVEARVPLQPYAGAPGQDGWRTATIPLSAFRGRGLPDFSLMDVLFVTFENSISSGQGVIFLDDLQFRRESAFAVVADFDRYPMEYNFLGGGFRTVEKGAAAISAGYHEDRAGSQAAVIGTVIIAYGGTIGLDYGEGRFSYAIWETDLLGFDARTFQNLVIKIRGEKGGEKPNIYLDDGTTRRCLRAGEFPVLTTSWQEIRLPLRKFASQGVDLSHLEALQFDFEWEETSGTIYIAEIRFEGVDSSEAIPSATQTGGDLAGEAEKPTSPVSSHPLTSTENVPRLSAETEMLAGQTTSLPTGIALIGIGLLGVVGLGLAILRVIRRRRLAGCNEIWMRKR